jgi:hypothetical protein
MMVTALEQFARAYYAAAMAGGTDVTSSGLNGVAEVCGLITAAAARYGLLTLIPVAYLVAYRRR